VSALRAVHVLVGLVADDTGRWLVNRRRDGTHMAGFWEFPGGKRQPNEERFAALARELDEELGIEVVDAVPLLEIAHDYPDKRVLLDVWHVRAFRGVVSAREGQALKWIGVDEFASLELLAADWPIVERLRGLRAAAAS
jgi:8-oxo-dGTP diphosphatase